MDQHSINATIRQGTAATTRTIATTAWHHYSEAMNRPTLFPVRHPLP